MPERPNVTDCNVTYLGKRLYRVTPRVPNNFYIAMTGSDVNFDFSVDKSHRLVRMIVKHTDSSKDESMDSLSLTLQRMAESGLRVDLFEDTAILATDIVIEFGVKYEFGPTPYRLTGNSTNTDRLYVEWIIQLLE